MRRLHFSGFLLVSFVLTSGPVISAEDIRDNVQTVPSSSVIDPLIDLNGVVFGLPFGASEDEAIKAFGKPDGYVRLDPHRTALLYGKSDSLFFYNGNFDAIRIDRSTLDWEDSTWIAERPPFTAQIWRLSNGIKPEMNLKEVEAKAGAQPSENKYRVNFSSDKSDVNLSLSRRGDLGDGDEAYVVFGLLMAAKHGGKNNWSQPIPGIGSATSVKGQKMLGMMLGDSAKGIRIRAVFKKSPADMAGLKSGDLIVGLNGENVVGTTTADFIHRIGDANKLVVLGPDRTRREVEVARVDGSTFSNQLVGPLITLSEVNIGDVAPDFDIQCSDGTKVKLSDLRGAPVLINFTATWCGPCRQETPLLVALYGQYKNQGLKMISLYLDEAKTDVAGYAKSLGATWLISNDGKLWDDPIVRAYGVGGVPTNVLVGKDGKILKAESGGGPPLDSAIEAALK